MTVAELKERAALEAETARGIKDKADQEGRGMTSDEASIFDEHMANAERVEQESIRQARLEATEARLNATQPKKADTEFANGARIDAVLSPEKLFRFGKLRSFTGSEAERSAYIAGRWLMATVMNSAESRQWCHEHGVEIRVQTEGGNTAGGFLVPDVLERAIIDLRETYGQFRQNCRVMPMSSDHSIIPRRTGGVSAFFIGESTEITASDKAWNQVELTAKKLGTLSRMSTDLSEDAVINVADDLTSEMAHAFAVKEDQCGIDGDGTSAYGGMTGIRVKMVDGLHDGGWVTSAACDNWTEITAAMLSSMMSQIPAYALPGAKWYCSPVAKASVFDRLAMAASGNTLANIAAGAMAAYGGYPIVTMPAMPTTDDAAALNGKIMLLFGDLRLSTTLGDRRGITIKVSTDRYMEFDQIGIQATERFCIVNHDVGGATVATRGPIVGWKGTT
jgi:HK97 family phage major capsid protein